MFLNIIDDYLISSEKIEKIENKELILLKNSSVFGNGSHETTKIMIKLMKKCDFKEKTCLDIGCGTGILSIIASKKGSLYNTLIDNNIYACEIANENLQLNNIQPEKVEILNKKFESYNDKKVDIVLANQTVKNLLLYGNVFQDFIKQDGFLIVSGFTNMYRNSIKNKFCHLGYKIVYEYQQNFWSGFIFQKI